MSLSSKALGILIFSKPRALVAAVAAAVTKAILVTRVTRAMKVMKVTKVTKAMKVMRENPYPNAIGWPGYTRDGPTPGRTARRNYAACRPDHATTKCRPAASRQASRPAEPAERPPRPDQARCPNRTPQAATAARKNLSRPRGRDGANSSRRSLTTAHGTRKNSRQDRPERSKSAMMPVDSVLLRTAGAGRKPAKPFKPDMTISSDHL